MVRNRKSSAPNRAPLVRKECKDCGKDLGYMGEPDAACFCGIECTIQWMMKAVLFIHERQDKHAEWLKELGYHDADDTGGT